MKKIFFAVLALLLMASCQKDDTNTIYYPGQNSYSVPEGSIFDGVYLEHPLYVASSVSPEFQESFTTLNAHAKSNDYCGRVYYGSMNDNANEVLRSLEEDEVVIIVEPNIDIIQPWLQANGYDEDLTSVRGNVLLAYTGKGEFYVINRWIEGDILGSLNGLATWLNQREQAKKKKQDMAKDATPQVTDLFDYLHNGFTYNYGVSNYEVASISCSDADYLSGTGNVVVTYDVYPVHCFDGQQGAGDYYYVKLRTQVNSAGMYTPTTRCGHGGVWVHKQGFWLKEFGIATKLLDGSTIVGQFPVDGFPQPGTTQGSTSYSYTSGLTWNIGGSLTGGYSKEKKGFGELSINGGVSVSNSTTETRVVGDISISNNSTLNEAKYRYTLMNLPDEDNIRNWDNSPNAMAIGGCEMYQGFIIYVPSSVASDTSTKEFLLSVTIDRLLYQCQKDQSSCCNHRMYNVDVTNQVNTPHVMPLGLPNRIKTGLVSITHDDVTKGNYMFTVTASDGTNTYTLNEGTSIPRGQTLRRYIPIGSYTFSVSLGNQANNTTTYTSLLETLNVADSIHLHTGADFGTAE